MHIRHSSNKEPDNKDGERTSGDINDLNFKEEDFVEDGEPNEWWDKTSTPPMCSFPRFDLQESTYSIGLMADRTPAWREGLAFVCQT